ncbi:hypothetical protein ACOSP7_000372 [Xanthoceras sorbifolium]
MVWSSAAFISSKIEVVCWSPHSSGFKVNVDAAVNLANRSFGVGIVVRDSSGLLVFAAGQFFDNFFDVESAEAKAIQLGISCACFLQLSRAVIESDALNVVRLCGGTEVSLTEVDNIVQDVIFLLGLNHSYSVAFVPRLGNNVAHCITKRAVSGCVSCSWFSSFPDWLVKLARMDGCSGGSS